MSNFRKVILVILINITIILWLAFIFTVIFHKEDPKLINYESPKEEEHPKIDKKYEEIIKEKINAP